MPRGADVLRSRVDGEGPSNSPEGPSPVIGSVGQRFTVIAFAEALYQLAFSLVEDGVNSHYEDHFSPSMRIDANKEMNARITELVIATQGHTSWQDADVDLVFEAVHAARDRHDSQGQNAGPVLSNGLHSPGTRSGST